MKEIKEIINGFFEPPIREYLSKIPAGKLLRSRLICAIAKDSVDRYLLSAIIETIHLASLLHDDVVDNAKIRRGVPSIGASEGAKTAIMVGDIFYSTAFSRLVVLGEEIAKIVSLAVAKLSRGEMLDVELSKSFNESKEKYENMIYLKTSALIEASCEAAAILARKDRERFRKFGALLGVAFQIIDDVLDITQDEATLGKPALNDLSEGKATLPLIYFYQKAEKSDREKLLALFGKPIEKTDADWLKEALESSGAIDSSLGYAKGLLGEAKALVFDDSELSAIAEALVSRIK
ncbi:MAG: polyprenyl synthetase family protein [Helicobacteraceae bacterium]|jgi:octaprenyl-diphosphate synthase|nr:polyprenyl synthetase family protein [Helicobacteraceae bacterium]